MGGLNSKNSKSTIFPEGCTWMAMPFLMDFPLFVLSHNFLPRHRRNADMHFGFSLQHLFLGLIEWGPLDVAPKNVVVLRTAIQSEVSSRRNYSWIPSRGYRFWGFFRNTIISETLSSGEKSFGSGKKPLIFLGFGNSLEFRLKFSEKKNQWISNQNNTIRQPVMTVATYVSVLLKITALEFPC